MCYYISVEMFCRAMPPVLYAELIRKVDPMVTNGELTITTELRWTLEAVAVRDVPFEYATGEAIRDLNVWGAVRVLDNGLYRVTDAGLCLLATLKPDPTIVWVGPYLPDGTFHYASGSAVD